MGLAGTNWELDFKQCSFHHIMQVLRICRFSTFALPPAFPPCCCPLAFRRQVRRLTYRMSSESYPGSPECVVSCHGAERMTNSIRYFDRLAMLAVGPSCVSHTPCESALCACLLSRMFSTRCTPWTTQGDTTRVRRPWHLPDARVMPRTMA